MKPYTRFAWTAALVYFCCQILPFVFFGIQWSIFWYPISLPFSALLKPYLYDLGAEFYIGAVTIVNSLGVFAICYLPIRLLWLPKRK
jgi:hypothetical protein